MNNYWQGFGQVNDPENFQQKVTDEFREELPFEDLDEKGLLDAKAPRRDFLKYLGFSTAAATLAASCKMPVRKAIPFANRPENIVPGEAKYYAPINCFTICADSIINGVDNDLNIYIITATYN